MLDSSGFYDHLSQQVLENGFISMLPSDFSSPEGGPSHNPYGLPLTQEHRQLQVSFYSQNPQIITQEQPDVLNLAPSLETNTSSYQSSISVSDEASSEENKKKRPRQDDSETDFQKPKKKRSKRAKLSAEEKKERKEIRKEKNRISAANSRARKKQYVEELEEQVTQLTELNVQLQAENAYLRAMQTIMTNEEEKNNSFELSLNTSGRQLLVRYEAQQSAPSEKELNVSQFTPLQFSKM